MKGSMRERKPGVWELRVYVGVDPISGSKRVISRRFRGGKRDAQTALAQLVAEVADPEERRRSNPAKITLTGLIEEHLLAWEGSATTKSSYRSLAVNHIDPTIGRLEIGKLDARILDRFYRWLREEKNLSPSSIKSVHSLIRGALRQAVAWGWLGSNPARDARPPTVRQGSIDLPSADQVISALEQLVEIDLEYATFVRLVAATGARRGEICAVTWDAVDFDGAELRIDSAVISTTETGLIVQDTKTHINRTIGLDPDTIEVLVAHRVEMDDRAAAAGVVVESGSFVFSHEPDGSRPWRPDNVSTRWDRLRDRVGLTGVRLHDLRHFQATMLLKAGVPVKNVSKRLGHRDSTTTLNVYAQFLQETDRESAELIGNLLARRSPVADRD